MKADADVRQDVIRELQWDAQDLPARQRSLHTAIGNHPIG
jgi:hypothetical protein